MERLTVPSMDDLYGLVKLCGSNDGVVNYLARVYGLEADIIKPTVLEWLSALPPLPPPSRQRSAPAAPERVPRSGLASLVAARNNALGPQILPIRELPTLIKPLNCAGALLEMRLTSRRLPTLQARRPPLHPYHLVLI